MADVIEFPGGRTESWDDVVAELEAVFAQNGLDAEQLEQGMAHVRSLRNLMLSHLEELAHTPWTADGIAGWYAHLMVELLSERATVEVRLAAAGSQLARKIAIQGRHS